MSTTIPCSLSTLPIKKNGCIDVQRDDQSDMVQHRLTYLKNSLAEDVKQQQQNSALIAEHARLPREKRVFAQGAQIGKSESSNQDSEEDGKDSESANDDSEDFAPAQRHSQPEEDVMGVADNREEQAHEIIEQDQNVGERVENVDRQQNDPGIGIDDGEEEQFVDENDGAEIDRLMASAHDDEEHKVRLAEVTRHLTQQMAGLTRSGDVSKQLFPRARKPNTEIVFR